MTNRSTSLALATVLSLCAAAPAVAQRLGDGLGEAVKSVGSGAADLGTAVGNGVGDTVRDLARDRDRETSGGATTHTTPYLPAGLSRLMETGGQVATIRPLGQERVLEAVRTRRALPLAQLLEQAGMAGDGRLIDARLVQAGSFLLYEIKLIAPSGDVRQRYYYARSGLPVE